MRYNDTIPMDKECIEFCDTLNRLPNIKTINSCCGHGKTPYYVILETCNIESLRPIIETIYTVNFPVYPWELLVYIKGIGYPLNFVIRGPIGEQAYSDAIKFSKN